MEPALITSCLPVMDDYGGCDCHSKRFFEGVFWGLAVANSSDDGSHGLECCTSWYERLLFVGGFILEIHDRMCGS
jgi:hypothetical protein